MLCHLSALAGFFFPFGAILGPLICWLSRRDESVWIYVNGRSALNFQLSMLLYMVSGYTIDLHCNRNSNCRFSGSFESGLYNYCKHKGFKRRNIQIPACYTVHTVTYRNFRTDAIFLLTAKHATLSVSSCITLAPPNPPRGAFTIPITEN